MATYVIGGVLLLLMVLACRHVIKNRNRHACCGGNCGQGCHCDANTAKPNPPGYDNK